MSLTLIVTSSTTMLCIIIKIILIIIITIMIRDLSGSILEGKQNNKVMTLGFCPQ